MENNWKKINQYVSYLEKPVITDPEGRPMFALAVFDERNEADEYEGIVRYIVGRTGIPGVSGNTDYSTLRHITSKDGFEWQLGPEVVIKDQEKIIKAYQKPDREFVGLEDPDIFRDPTGKVHVFFTMPYRITNKKHKRWEYYLGHATGSSVHDLEMQEPVAKSLEGVVGFKELCVTSRGEKMPNYYLTESGVYHDDLFYSTIARLKADSLDEPWGYIDMVFDPYDRPEIAWASEHASPAFLIPEELLAVGSLRVGIMNGRSNSKKLPNGKRLYGEFVVGLFLFDPKTGDMSWISPEPLFIDPDMTNICFASSYLVTESGDFYMYAHVDDTFIRVYKLDLNAIKNLIQF